VSTQDNYGNTKLNMKVKLPIPRESQRSGKIEQGTVFIAANLIRKSERLDRNGNIIDPRTQQIINKNKEQE
jgi:hypothetical protein